MKKALIATVIVAATIVGSTAPAFAAEKSKTPNVEKKQISTRAARAAGYVMINGDGVRLRAEAGLNGTILTLLYKGTLVEYNNEAAYIDGREWLRVRYGSLEGYVAEEYVTFGYKK